MRSARRAGLVMLLLLLAPSLTLPALAETVQSERRPATSSLDDRQSLDDAWWTGPISVSSADTMPVGHFYTEPYLFDVISQGKHRIGSLIYIQYGLFEKLTIGAIPKFWRVRRAGRHQFVAGDIELLSQLRLSKFEPGGNMPTIALLLQRRIPFGRHDGLGQGDEAASAGAGATSIGVNLQHYFWMPNGRLLRGRINVLRTYSQSVKVHGRSYYGTSDTFRGRARPGAVLGVGGSLEYSVSRQFALALDVMHDRAAATYLHGYEESAGSAVDLRIAPSASVTISPAIEYSWSPKDGVLVGFRYSPKGRNSPQTITPVIAYSRSW